MTRLSMIAAAALTAGLAAPALAQTIAGPQAPSPNYVSIPLEIEIDRPIADVWKRVGKFCDIAEWLQIAAGCKTISGVEEEMGSVRSVGTEVMVGKTQYSYTYTMPLRPDRPYNLYHGTMAAVAMGPKKTKIVYTLMYDNSLVPGDAAAKKAEMDGRKTRFQQGLANMKILAEGGKLPPPPAPVASPAKPQ